MTYTESVKSLLLGIAVGDAIGTTAVSKSRTTLLANPITTMEYDEIHNQPAGSWANTSATTFCLAEVIAAGYSPEALGQLLIAWAYDNYWTAQGAVLDIGKTTAEALRALHSGVSPLKTGATSNESNGCGSLMRVAPLVFMTDQNPITKRWQMAREVSEVTHAHFTSVVSCFYYLEFLRHIFHGSDKLKAYKKLSEKLPEFFDSCGINESNYAVLSRLLKTQISKAKESDIQSTSYVIDTLEAVIWCVMTEKTFSSTVLKAVNLGGNTATITALTAGIAALIYGYDAIPAEWLSKIARRQDIENLAERMAKKLER